MPAKIRTIKASSVSVGDFFDFNRSINYKGETGSTFTLKQKKSGVFKVTVFQEVMNNDSTEILRFDPIYKGKIKNVQDPDNLTNFVGSIKLKKQMHNCEWNLQKHFKNKKPEDPEFIACTLDYVPTRYDFMLKSDLSGKKYLFEGIGKFKSEGIDYLDESIT